MCGEAAGGRLAAVRVVLLPGIVRLSKELVGVRLLRLPRYFAKRVTIMMLPRTFDLFHVLVCPGSVALFA